MMRVSYAEPRRFLLNTQQLSAMTPADIECAAQLLKQGQLVAIPTETVYGLAADATQPEAVKQILVPKVAQRIIR